MSEQNDQPLSEALDGVPAIYRLPASKKSLAQNQFQFQVEEDGPVLSIPKLKFVKPSLAVKIEDMPLNQAVILLLDSFHPGLLDTFDDGEQFDDFMRAWAKASGINIPESRPSSDSSENTEGQSNTTSGATATA